MNNFNRNKSNGSRSFGKRRFGGNRDSERSQMYSAVCSNCGKDCQVPFRPTGEKPVYCRDCFAKMRNHDVRGGSRRDERAGFRMPDHSSHAQTVNDKQIAELSMKLDKILALLRQSIPTVSLPVQEESMPERVEVEPVLDEAKPAKKAKKTTTKKAKAVKAE